MIVVADTSPICYLLLIGHVDLLRTLFSEIVIPQAVLDELSAEDAPNELRSWVSDLPSWIRIEAVAAEQNDEALKRLHRGEREALMLAEQLEADLIVLDEKAARKVASQRGLRVTGLLGILNEAGRLGLVNLPAAVDRLRKTTFRMSPRILKLLLENYK